MLMVSRKAITLPGGIRGESLLLVCGFLLQLLKSSLCINNIKWARFGFSFRKVQVPEKVRRSSGPKDEKAKLI